MWWVYRRAKNPSLKLFLMFLFLQCFAGFNIHKKLLKRKQNIKYFYIACGKDVYKLLTKAIKYAIVIGSMLKDIIPKNKTYSFLYTIVATIIAVSHLFSLDKTTALNVGDFSDSKSLLNVSRLCGLIVAILWIIIIRFALINGLNVGMLGVYLMKPSLIFLLLILYLAFKVFWRDKS